MAAVPALRLVGGRLAVAVVVAVVVPVAMVTVVPVPELVPGAVAVAHIAAGG